MKSGSCPSHPHFLSHSHPLYLPKLIISCYVNPVILCYCLWTLWLSFHSYSQNPQKKYNFGIFEWLFHAFSYKLRRTIMICMEKCVHSRNIANFVFLWYLLNIIRKTLLPCCQNKITKCQHRRNQICWILESIHKTMASVGVEPTTFALLARRSNRLS